MREAITKRVSRRSFTGVPFTAEEQNKIHALVESANQESGLLITFLENAGTEFGSFRKTYGMFKNVRSILVMKGPKDDLDLREKCGYYGESIVLDLVDLGIDSCWVGGTFDKAGFPVDGAEELVCLIVIGKTEKLSMKEKLLRAGSGASKNRKTLEERLTSTAEIPDWVRNGIEAVRLAPSAVNKQKPHFTYDGKTLTASVDVDYHLDLVDLGIAKKHFESEADGHFPFGNGVAFEPNT